jgi:hypothetical protein
MEERECNITDVKLLNVKLKSADAKPLSKTVKQNRCINFGCKIVKETIM